MLKTCWMNSIIEKLHKWTQISCFTIQNLIFYQIEIKMLRSSKSKKTKTDFLDIKNQD